MDTHMTMHMRVKLLPAMVLAVFLFTGGNVHADSPTVTHITYDPGNNVVGVTDPRNLVTTYAHDGLGQLWQQVSPDTGTTHFTYDAYGRPLSMTRADGVSTTYGYDSLNRPTTVSAGELTQQASYDTCTHGIGRLCGISDATGTTSYSYTPEGWIAGRGFSIGSTTYALGYGYNSMGQIASVVYPDGNSALYSYTRGMVAGVAIQIGSTTSSVASAVVYRPGNAAMSSWTSSNGLTNVLAYDTDGRLKTISVPGVQSLALTYDSANRISSLTNGIDGTLTQTFGYDAMSRLSTVSSIADNESYQYDANGNRIAQVSNGVSTLSTVSATSNRLSGFGSTSYGYDTRGNTTTVAGAATYHYDAFNRMDSAAGTSYYVNPEGQRLRKSGTAGTSYFAPDSSGSLLAESQGSGWTDYVWLNGRLVGRVAGGQINAVHDDQVGRPEVVTNAAQAIVWRAQNFAFNQNVVVSNITFNLGFPGQYYDAETAAWNNGYRDYKSELGRYVESDPMGLNGGINTYAYVGGNPLNYTDPLGLAWFTTGYKYHAAGNIWQWLVNRGVPKDDDFSPVMPFADPSNEFGDSRDVIQVWRNDPSSCPKKGDPKDGAQRSISQKYGKAPDPWAIGGSSFHWVPVVPNDTTLTIDQIEADSSHEEFTN